MSHPVMVAGLDLAASSARCSGYAVVDLRARRLASAGCSEGDQEVLASVRGASVVAIDSPLSIPEGGAYRSVDVAFMRETGYRLLPPSWRSMRALSERAMRLADELSGHGALIIETHPRSALLASGCASVDELLDTASVDHLEVPSVRDVRDAVVAAIVALYHSAGEARRITAADGSIYTLHRIC